MRNVFLIVALFLFSSSAFSQQDVVVHFVDADSAIAACNSTIDSSSCLTHSFSGYSVARLFCRDDTGRCTRTGGSNENWYRIDHRWDHAGGCPGEQVPDSNGKCVDGGEPDPEPEQCELEVGEFVGVMYLSDPLSAAERDKWWCHQNCQTGIQSYWRNSDLSPDQPGMWNYNMQTTGETCTSGGGGGDGGGGDPGQGDEGDGGELPGEPDPNASTDDPNDAPREDDPEDGGTGPADPNAAQTQLDCNSRPFCKGDAIQCAQLIELNRLRCSTARGQGVETGTLDGLIENIGDNLDESIRNEVDGFGDQLTTDYYESLNNSYGENWEGEMDTRFLQKLQDAFSFGGCQDLSVNVMGHAFAITCGDTAQWREFMAYVFAVITLIGCIEIAVRPVAK